MKHFFLILFSVLLLSSCTETKVPEVMNTPVVKTDNSAPQINYTLINTTPHDTTSFTEGLLFYNNQLFESTGAPEYLAQAKSLFGTVDLKTGKITTKVEIDKTKYFGEGIVFFKDKVYQLTYKNQIGFIYDAKTFKKTGEFSYQNKEGWGFTTDGSSLIMSDGTNTLTYFDPATLKVSKTLQVSSDGYAEDYLNELEFIKGFIYANIWNKNYIVKIDPNSGKVVGRIDLSALINTARNKHQHSLEMNGIAYDAATDKIYVTGKFWPDLYEINFQH